MNKRIIAAAAGMGLLAALIILGLKAYKIHQADEAKDTEEEHRPKDSAQGRRVVLTPEQIQEQGITFAPAGPAVLETSLRLPGEISLNTDRTARLTPRFAGVAREVYKNLGDKVKKGDLLAVIESNESLSPYELRSPMAGTVVEKNITLGQLLKEDSPAFVVADLSEVWLNIGIFPEDLSRIKVGQAVRVRSSEGNLETQGMVSYLAPTANGETRTLQARVVLPNRDGSWKPGLFAEARIVVGRIQAPVTVPKEAVQTLDGKPSVFHKTARGIEPVFPALGAADDRRLEIRQGLAAGDTIVVGNAYLLKSELEKASFTEEEAGDDEKDKD